ncbi:TrmH family RNA methyltransferase [Aeribacillus alveayuensis]|uniref:TrmH family RNA methyltransferase n=1 Tax=Aeribacillus alveayuensis TaxID=279215 RepID=A0ABT9VJM1_9BACI|nr:TrmH family RNA methyltransferase [Bacillus alveayuensis]
MKMIESQQNPKVKAWKKLLTKKGRDQTGLFIIEGFHLVEEALKEQHVVKEIMKTKNVEIPATWDVTDVPIVTVTNEIMKGICDTETPQGIASVCKQQNDHSTKYFRKFILVDRVQDPGNLGTIIRTADAAGIDAVILGAGTVDVYNAKTIRATQGSLFHLPILKGDLTTFIAQLKQRNIPIYGTSLTNGVSYKEVSPTESFAIIVGNEGNGVSQTLLQMTDKNLYIPLYGKAESLNVAIASSILMYHFVH